jgi:hypothetical protein
VRTVLGWILTFHTVALLWVLFRAGGFMHAVDVVRRLFSGWELARIAVVVRERPELLGVVAAGFVLSLAPERWWHRLELRFQRARWPLQAVAVILVVQAVVQVSTTNVRPFLYFQF